jgi:hypothetical protein
VRNLDPVTNHQPPDAGPYRLSKSCFTSGLQCHKKLWWEVHDRDAIELQPDKVLQDLLEGLLGLARQFSVGGVPEPGPSRERNRSSLLPALWASRPR